MHLKGESGGKILTISSDEVQLGLAKRERYDRQKFTKRAFLFITL